MIEELRVKAEALGVKVDGRWKAAKLLQVIADASDVPAVCMTNEPQRIDDMNAAALRIWAGQSPDNPRHWRIERVKAGLTKLGYADILDHLSVPNG